MSDVRRWSRRRFLGFGAATAAAAAAGWAIGCRRGQPLSAAQLAAALGLAPARTRLGARCIALAGGEADPQALAALITRDLGWKAVHLDGPRLQEALADRVRQDYEGSRLVEVEGWTLSLTEARLAALLELLAPEETPPPPAPSPVPTAEPSASPATTPSPAGR